MSQLLYAEATTVEFPVGGQLVRIPDQFAQLNISGCIKLIHEQCLVPDPDQTSDLHVSISNGSELVAYLRSCHLFKRYLLFLVFVYPRTFMQLSVLTALISEVESKQMKKHDMVRFNKEMIIFSRLLQIGKLDQVCRRIILAKKCTSVFGRLGSYQNTQSDALEALFLHIHQHPNKLFSVTELHNWLLQYGKSSLKEITWNSPITSPLVAMPSESIIHDNNAF